jgi:RNA polymerase sigma-70 factor (ECF subfamily)
VFRRRNRDATPPPPDLVASSLDPDAAREARLIAAAKQGDLAAFNVLVTLHERSVYGLCFRILGEQMAAEDAAQDAFLKAWSSIATFRGELFRAWLLRIATNRCYDVIRAKGRRPADSLDAFAFEPEPTWTSQAGGAEQPEQHAARTELSRHLELALASLPDDQRLTIILSDIEERSYEEIAEITGAAIGTVKSRLSRARARLREMLRAQPEQRELLERFGRHYDE